MLSENNLLAIENLLNTMHNIDPVCTILPLAYDDVEQPIFGAPEVKIAQNKRCIPQHYLQYKHSYQSVCKIVDDISFDSRYPIFVSDDSASITIQVGVIGHNNYKVVRPSDREHIVYGRKWRVEPNLPTSEIIQTIFLALQKAKEHELRELFTLKSLFSGKTTTPFSGHQDAPLLARILNVENNAYLTDDTTSSDKWANLASLLSRVKFDGMALKIRELKSISAGRTLLDFAFDESSRTRKTVSFFNDPDKITFTIIVKDVSDNVILHHLVDEIISVSNIEVANSFSYRNFKRFSRQVDIDQISNISSLIRNTQFEKVPVFNQYLKNANFEIDSSRVPVLPSKEYGLKVKLKLSGIDGHMPYVK